MAGILNNIWKERGQMVMFWLVLGLAAWLRFLGIGSKSLWYDEAWSVALAAVDLKTAVILVKGQIYPPLYQILLHFWLLLFGTSETAARSLSAVFGIASVAALYNLTVRISGRRTALVAALILAVSPFHVEYSQEARGYSLLVLLSLLSFDLLLVWLDEHKWMTGTAYAAFTALCLYTHPYGFLIPLSQSLIWIFHLIEEKKHPGKELLWWLGLGSAIALLFLPVLPVFLRAAGEVSRNFWIRRPDYWDIWNTLKYFLGQSLWSLVSLGLTVLLGLLSMLIYEGEHRFRAKIYLAWWWLPILAAFAFSSLAFSVYQIKYLIFASIPLYLLAAEGIAKLEHRTARIIMVLLIAASSVQPLLAYYQKPKIEEWRGTVNYIKSRQAPKDMVLIYQENDYDDMSLALSYYYAPDSSKVTEVEGVDDIKALKRSRAGLWLIVTHVQNPDSVELIKGQLARKYSLIEEQEFAGISLLRYIPRKRIK
ncbi:MAG: glycosyltransferase family 39 protein [bacterium]|nr:glycosyltransferase family 39 protein [bacterium]